MNTQQAVELKNTILWEEFCKEIDKKIEYQTGLILSCKPEDLIHLQQQIIALGSVKNIPQDVIDLEEPASAP